MNFAQLADKFNHLMTLAEGWKVRDPERSKKFRGQADQIAEENEGFLTRLHRHNEEMSNIKDEYLGRKKES